MQTSAFFFFFTSVICDFRLTVTHLGIKASVEEEGVSVKTMQKPFFFLLCLYIGKCFGVRMVSNLS